MTFPPNPLATVQTTLPGYDLNAVGGPSNPDATVHPDLDLSFSLEYRNFGGAS